MVQMETLAHPYVNALFAIAKSTNNMDKWLDDMSVLATVALDKEFTNLVDNPRISKDELIQTLLSFLTKPHDEIKRLLSLLQESGKLEILPEIHQLFKQKIENYKNIAHAVIESAFAMNEDDKEYLEQKLGKKFAKNIKANVVVNPELIGGVKILVNDMVIDLSVKGGLEKLATRII